MAFEETVWIGIGDIFGSSHYMATFPLFLFMMLGMIVVAVGIFLLIKYIIDEYIETKIKEHKRDCRKK